MTIGKDYLLGLKESVRRNSGPIPEQRGYEQSEWDARFTRCSRRLLSAVIFREMAQVTLERTGSPLLPTVGFYYTLFHAGIAMLLVEHKTSLDDLSHKKKQVKHQKIRALLESRLVQPGLIAREYVESFDRLKKLREYMNYSVGGRLPDDPSVWKSAPEKFYEETGEHLQRAVTFVREIGGIVEVDEVLGIDTIRLKIGDDFGDDMVQMYVPREHWERIYRDLVQRGITTDTEVTGL